MNPSEKALMAWRRKLKPGDHVTVFGIRDPATVINVGKPEGLHGDNTRTYLRRDSDGSRISARITQVFPPPKPTPDTDSKE